MKQEVVSTELQTYSAQSWSNITNPHRQTTDGILRFVPLVFVVHVDRYLNEYK